jgi:hypothetical protein
MTTLSEAAINRAAGTHSTAVLLHIIDWKGRPTTEVAALNPAAQPRRLNEWRILNTDTGSWRSLSGDSGVGPDWISLVAHLALVSRHEASEFLSGVLRRVQREVAA